MKKEFYDRSAYSITNYLYSYMMCSLYFAISNILFIIYFIFSTLTPDSLNLFFLYLFLIPLGPSIGALYFTISKLMRDKDISVTSCYWSFYKKNFLSFLKLWLIHLTILTVFLLDFRYFYANSPEKGIHLIFGALIVVSLIISLYTFPINSKFELKLKDLFLLSVYLMIKKFPITVLKAATVIVGYLLSSNLSLTFAIFIPGIICTLFYFYDKKIFVEIENNFNNTSESIGKQL